MSESARDRAIAALLLLATALFHASYAFHGVALFDEGLLADGAWRVARGDLPAVDATLPYGPATYGLVAGAFAAFGTSVATMRFVLIALQALCGGALYLLARRTTTRSGALLAVALFAVAHGSLHKSAIAAASALALLAAARIGARADSRAALEAGLATAGAFLFRHDVGGFAGIACAAALLLDARPERSAAWRRLLALGAGFAALLLPLLLALLAAGLDLPRWWALEWQRIGVQEAIAVSWSPFAETGEARWGARVLAAALLAAPLLHVAWGGGALLRWRRRAPLPQDALRIAAALFGLLLLNQARLIPSANHLFQAFLPVALAAADLLTRRGRGVAAHAAFALLVAGIASWAALGRSGLYSGTFKQRIDGAVAVRVATAGFVLRPEFAAALERLIEQIQRRVGVDEALATSPGSPLLAFLAQRRLAQPFAEPSYYYRSQRFQREVIAALERERPPLLVTDGSEPANFRFEEAAPLVAEWFARRYAPIATIGPFTLHERVR